MKKTVKVIRKGSIEEFEKEVQTAVDQGFDIKFSNGYAGGAENRYYALLIKEEQDTGDISIS